MPRVRMTNRSSCDACGSTYTDGAGLIHHHAWCLEESVSTPQVQSVGIVRAILAVLAVYAVTSIAIGLIVLWSAFHPSADSLFVVMFLALLAYVMAGERYWG